MPKNRESVMRPRRQGQRRRPLHQSVLRLHFFVYFVYFVCFVVIISVLGPTNQLLSQPKVAITLRVMNWTAVASALLSFWNGSPVEQRASEPLGCVLDMLLESTGVARFAAETSFHSDRAATAASRVSHALARLMEEGQPPLQHGLERWLVRRVGWHYAVPNRGTRETPDTYLLSNP